jgi:integrase
MHRRRSLTSTVPTQQWGGTADTVRPRPQGVTLVTQESSQDHGPRRWADPDYPGLHWRKTKAGLVPTIMLRVDGELRTHRLPASTSKTAAVKELRRLKTDRDGGLAAIPRGIRMSELSELAFRSLDAKAAAGKGSARTAYEYRRRWRIHLAHRLDRRKLADVDKLMVLKLRDELRQKGLAESSVGSVLVVLRSVLAFARECDYTTHDPFRGIRRGEIPSAAGPDGEKRVLRANEISQLIAATLPTYTVIVTVLSWSGLRISELLALRWQDISFVDSTISVGAQLSPSRRNAAPILVKPKSRRSRRVIPFLEIVRETLMTHLAAEQDVGRGCDSDFVFVTRTGRPYTRQNVSERGIEQAGRRAGLGDGIRAHTLRRSFCTLIAESGIPPAEAAALTGHTEAVWWRDYVQPRRDAQSRSEIVATLTARGIGVEP